MKAKPLLVLTPILIIGLTLCSAIVSCNNDGNTNNIDVIKTDTIPIESAVKLFFSDERKRMDDIETLDADTITVLKYAKLNDTVANATLKVAGLIQPAPMAVQRQPARYVNTMDWKFYNRNNNWEGISITGWIR